MAGLVTDTECVDAIATFLGCKEEWSGVDFDTITKLIGMVRPIPGVCKPEEYLDEMKQCLLSHENGLRCDHHPSTLSMSDSKSSNDQQCSVPTNATQEYISYK